MNYEYSTVEYAVLQQQVNKYFPGYAEFLLPCVPLAEELDIPSPRQNSANKNDVFKTTKVVTSKTITLQIPKDIVRDYKEKFIPAGTRFIVTFVGNDLNKPRIIGME